MTLDIYGVEINISLPIHFSKTKPLSCPSFFVIIASWEDELIGLFVQSVKMDLNIEKWTLSLINFIKLTYNVRFALICKV